MELVYCYCHSAFEYYCSIFFSTYYEVFSSDIVAPLRGRDDREDGGNSRPEP